MHTTVAIPCYPYLHYVASIQTRPILRPYHQISHLQKKSPHLAHAACGYIYNHQQKRMTLPNSVQKTKYNLTPQKRSFGKHSFHVHVYLETTPRKANTMNLKILWDIQVL